MHDEQILLYEEKKRIDELQVPDIQLIGVMVDKEDQKTIEFAYKAAIRTHVLIWSRDSKRSPCKKLFEIQVPNLNPLVKHLRKEEREWVECFTQTFHALVQHLLPQASDDVYTISDGTIAGTHYKGWGWVSRVDGD